MSIIVIVWAWSFDRSVKLAQKEQRPQTENPLKELQKEVPGLWQSLGAGLKNLFGDLSSQIPSAEEIDAELESSFEQEPKTQAPEPSEVQPTHLPEVE